MPDLDGVIEVAVHQVEKTGRYWVACPMCPKVINGFTEQGTVIRLCDHMNEQHKEPRIGHA